MALLAHGAAGHGDLPVEPWLVAYGAAFALLLAFAALRLSWPSPRLAAAAAGRAAPAGLSALARWVLVGLQVLALLLFAVTLSASWFGPDSASRNIAPSALHVALWTGVPLLSATFGDWWRRVNPLWTLAAGLDRLRGRDPGTSTAMGWWATHWPAAAGLLALQWLQVAHPDPDALTAVAVLLGAYTVAVLAGAARFGAGWVRNGDGFAVLFHLFAALSPLHRDQAGRLRVRAPGAGLATVPVRSGTLAVLVVVLGGVTFDGVRRTRWWGDVAGGRRDWDLALVDTGGLLLTIATVLVAYLAAIRVLGIVAGEDDDDLAADARRWAPALVPAALGLLVAHHLSRLVFDGQGFLALLSDPYGEGWDLLGTAGHRIDYTIVTPGQLAWVQVVALVAGHVAAVVVAHDLAVSRWPHHLAVRSQIPVLAVLVASAVAGVLLLLSA